MKRSGFIFLAIFFLPVAPAALARMPSDPYENFRVKTDDVPQAEIAGWFLPAKAHAKGTLFILHGYNNNKGYMVQWDWVRDQENWNVITIDFREHGESSHSGRLSTLGFYEIYDVKAAVDFAESRGLAKPYAIFGRSLGAATGLRWASQDPRIAGVFAVSPFKNAYLASSELPADRLHIKGLPSPFALSTDYRKMLEQVDIPKAVAQRKDLRIWIMTGEFDAFKAPEQQEILNASASPPEMKRLEIAMGCNHRNVWSFKGDATHIGHDQYLKDFLKAVERDRPVWAAKWSLGLTAVFCAAFAGLFVFMRRLRVRPAAGPELPEPDSAIDPGVQGSG